jgi:hypothetical protein
LSSKLPEFPPNDPTNSHQAIAILKGRGLAVRSEGKTIPSAVTPQASQPLTDEFTHGLLAAAKERVRWWKPESGNREQKKSGPHLDKTYVLGASAVLHFVDDDIGGGRMERRFQEASRHKSPLLMSVLNWGEGFYHDWQLRGRNGATNDGELGRAFR